MVQAIQKNILRLNILRLAGFSPVLLFGLVFWGLGAETAFAQDTAIDKADTAWMIVASALVLMMTLPGLALFYGGMVRKKNVLAITTQIFASACMSALLWMVLGYSLAFGDGGSLNWLVGGFDYVFLNGIGLEDAGGTIPDSLFVMFQMTFAIITPALITGAFADRMKFSASLIFLGSWMLIVYAPVCHWVWGGGFLGDEGVLDFAGGTVVHINAGIAGLVAALVLGPRHNYRKENMAPHNLVLSMIGASFLWVGWFGFNAGSAVAADGLASMAMLSTQIAAAAAAMAWMVFEWMTYKKASLLGIISGAIGGLVAITPAAGFVDPQGALVIGLLAGMLCFYGSTKLKAMLRYDDSLDVFGVHGIGGIVGAILTGVFAREAIGGTPGAIEGNVGLVWTQIIGLVSTIVWSAVGSWVLLKITGALVGGLRVERDVEVEGLDVNLHGETVQ